MTDYEKNLAVRLIIGVEDNSADDKINAYLALARSRIMGRAYPFGGTHDFPERYDGLHVELTSRLYLRRGAEGETSHSENGVNRSYSSSDDADLLSAITPCSAVIT